MKAKELKIGDWVYRYNPITQEAIPSQVTSVSANLVEVDNDFVSDPNEMSPIPLDEDILKEYGWKRSNTEIFTNSEYSYIEIYYCNRYKLHEFRVNIGDRCMKIINSVHELQHILWALGIDDDLEV